MSRKLAGVMVVLTVAIGFALTVAIGFATARADDDTGSNLTRAEADALVTYHNKIRTDVSCPDVAWSAEVARFAQQWANHIAETGKIEHRSWSGEGIYKQKYGENWGAGSNPDDYSAMSAAEGWAKEKDAYPPGTAYPESGGDKFWHYTQMIWGKTTEIGAGKAVIKTGDNKGWLIVVCNYNPPGNYKGQNPTAK